MAIIKEKKIRVLSEIENLLPSGAPDGECERTEASYDAFFKISEGKYEISYSEMSDSGKIVSTIVISESSVKLTRRGAIESDMTFSPGLSDKSLYSLPPYSFDMVITTRKIRNNLTRDGGRLDIFYNMQIGGADKRVRMTLTVE